MRRTLLALVAALALAAPARAEDLPRDLAPAARTYGYEQWPATKVTLAGIDPSSIETPRGLVRTGVEVDARRGEARVLVAAPVPGVDEPEPTAVLLVRVFDAPATARRALLEALAHTQTKLARDERAGDLGFSRVESGRTLFFAAVRANVLFVARGVAPGTDVADLALAADRALRAAPVLEEGMPAPAPRIHRVQIEPARPGRPSRVRVLVDPTGPAAAHVAFDSSDENVSVLEAGEWHELHAARAGTVKITVSACSKELRVATQTIEVEVAPTSE